MYCFMETILNTEKSTNISFPPLKVAFGGSFLIILGVSILLGDLERPMDIEERQTQAPVQPQILFLN